jgi:hypothetical protein
MFHCPKCSKPLGEVPASGILEAICANCRFKSQLSLGRLAGKTTRHVVGPATATHQTQTNALEYELRLELPGRKLETLSFLSPGNDDWIRVEQGDTVGFVYSMRDATREDLLSVVNYSTGKSFNLAKPGEKAGRRAIWLSVGATALVFIALGSVGAPHAVTGLLGAVAGLGSYFGLRQRLQPVHQIPADRHAELQAGQSLLEQKAELQASIRRVKTERAERVALRERLAGLQAKMKSVAIPAYEPRIAALDSGLRTIDEQLELDSRLLDEYAKVVTILEIEYEAGTMASAISEELPEAVLDRRDELKDLERHQAELAILLAANAEVERALRSTTER